MKSTGKLDNKYNGYNHKQRSTCYHRHTEDDNIDDLRQGGCLERQTWIGRGRYSPRGERDVAPRRLRGVTTSSCPHKELWKGVNRTCQTSLNQVSPVSSVCRQSTVQSLFVRYPRPVSSSIFQV